MPKGTEAPSLKTNVILTTAAISREEKKQKEEGIPLLRNVAQYSLADTK
jgi:hypothetical protein